MRDNIILYVEFLKNCYSVQCPLEGYSVQCPLEGYNAVNRTF